MSWLSVPFVVIAIFGLYLTNRDFWHKLAGKSGRLIRQRKEITMRVLFFTVFLASFCCFLGLFMWLA